MYRIFGEDVPGWVMLAGVAVLAVCLLALKLRLVLFLTIVFLILPSLNTPLLPLARLLRWAFLTGLLAKGLFSNLQGGIFPRPMTLEHRLLMLLMIAALASASWSMNGTISTAQAGMMVVLWLGVFLVLWNSWRSEDDILLLCNSLYLVAALLFSAQAVYLVFGLGASTDIGRQSGVFTNPNGLGTAAAFLGPFVYWKHRTTTGPLVRALCKGLGVVMVVSVFVSGSRSGALGGLVCLGVVLCYVRRLRISVVLVLVTSVTALIIFLGSQMDAEFVGSSGLLRVSTISNLSDRVPMWEEAYDLFLEKPWAGYGFGMSKFADIGRADMELMNAVYRMRGINYHSAFVQLGLELGIFALVLFIVFIALIFRRGLLIYRASETSPLHIAGIVFFAAYIALAADSAVHGWAFSPGSASGIVFWLTGAAVMRVHTLIADARHETAEETAEEEEAAADDAAKQAPEAAGAIAASRLSG